MSTTEINTILEVMGIVQSESMDDLFNSIESKCGTELAKQIEECIYQRGEADGSGGDQIYKLMNSSVESAIAVTGGYDGGYIKKCLGRLNKYPSCMGKRVADIGCNNGLLTCCLAKAYPESCFYGFDKNVSSIAIANEMAEDYGVKNASFSVSPFFDITGTYDTVFMSKVVHEIVDVEEIDLTQSRREVVEQYINLFTPIAKTIRKCLSDDGSLIAIERFPYIIETYGYIKTLCQAGLDINISENKPIVFKTVDGREELPFIIGDVGTSDMDAIDKYFNVLLDKLDQDYLNDLRNKGFL